MSKAAARKRKNNMMGSAGRPEGDKIKWSNELALELHKQTRKKFKRRKVITQCVDSIWAVDLLDLTRYATTNKNYKFLLMVIDTFSKYGWVIPLKNKTAQTVANAFDRLFLETKAPQKLWSDKGTEFYNRLVEQVLKRYHVSLYSTENEEKSCIVERWIRTIMRWMYIYFDTHRHTEYINILPALIERYNNTKHRSIGCTPIEARKPENYQKVYDSLYPSARARARAPPLKNNPKEDYKTVLKNSKKSAFQIGDQVRLSIIKNHFDKGYFRKWTEELFVIEKIKLTDPITYTVKSLNGEKIKGTFYKQQLQKSKQTEIFQIEKVIGKPRVRNGIREVRVKWSGYGNEFNSWVPENEFIHQKAHVETTSNNNSAAEEEDTAND